MKVLWCSVAPWVGSGYGQQTALFVPRLIDAGHDVAIAAHWGLDGAGMEWEGIKVYPAVSREWHWQKFFYPLIANEHADGDVNACQLITLVDVWSLTLEKLADLRVASWCPVDHDPLPPRVKDFFDRTGSRPIAMSRFGVDKLNDAGIDALYVPHGVDTTAYQPRPDRAAVREGIGLPADAFVVGMVAANIGSTPPRKAFPQVFQAFAEFRRRRHDAVLYLHTDRFGIEHGINLPALAAACGIPDEAVHFTNPLKMLTSIDSETMSYVYSAFDVLASPSYGEGFGIPIVEAQACGVPVIVTDWTAMPELCGAGWKVEGDPWFDHTQGAFYKCPSVMEIVDSLDDAYEHAAGMRDTARAFAVGYDADLVMRDYWLPVLDELAQPREVAPLALNGNRAQRRSLAKAGAR